MERETKYRIKTSIIGDIKNGLSKPKIAKKHRIGIKTLEMLLDKYGIDYERLKKVREKNIINDLKYQKASIVAERYNVSIQYLNRLINREKKEKGGKIFEWKWALNNWAGIGYFMD